MQRSTTWIARWAELIEATAVSLFLLQALRVLFSALFGLIYEVLFVETISLSVAGLAVGAVLLAFLTPLATPRQGKTRRAAALLAAVTAFLARLPLTLNDPQSQFVAAILIVAAVGLYLAARLGDGPREVTRGLLLALVIDQLLRVAGTTYDVTLRPGWWPAQVAISLALCLLSGWHYQRYPARETLSGTPMGLLHGLAWGGWLFVETSLLAFPNAVARWSDTPYQLVAPLLLAATLLPLLTGDRWMARWGRMAHLVSAIAMLGGLTIGALLSGPVALFGLLLAQWAAVSRLPSLFPPGEERHKGRRRGALVLGGILFLILSFAYAFAFTYAYTLDVFRGMGLPIFLMAALLVAVLPPRRYAESEAAPGIASRWAALLPMALVALVALVAWPHATTPAAPEHLHFATYNVHYGYDTTWHLSLEAQAQTIEASGADVVALQEVDTGRPTSYMVDDALWLAHRLGMEAIYLPCVERLTGIALLSRLPIQSADTLLLPSELEQTGILWAELDLGHTPVNAFATWLGLETEERARQLDAALPFLAAHPGPGAFGGDFNSTPDSPVYARLIDAGWVDPFPALGLGSPPTDPALDPTKRIDFVWLRDLTPVAAQVLDSLASDHHAVLVEVDRP